MAAYYNEFDKQAAQWLRSLIAAGHIAPGEVDDRSISDVTPADLAGFTQCHFFAGVGVWSLALRRAGWSDDRPVWTGSCPCQPFSAAGKGNGFADERHLWPHWYWLIEQCRPPAIYGEQVASKAAESWIDLVHADMEAVDYSFGCVPFPSASVGAPHIRDRNYWLANNNNKGSQGHREPGELDAATRWSDAPRHSGSNSLPEWMADHSGERGREAGNGGRRSEEWGGDSSESRGVVNDDRSDQINGIWSDCDWLYCRDGKWRPVEPGTFPLAHGAPSRVGRLRAYGNAINAEAARIFIESTMTC